MQQFILDIGIHSLSAQAGERYVLNVKGIEYTFRLCPPGTFEMGSPKDEYGRDYRSEYQHRVFSGRGFLTLETLVTQAMWKSIMGKNPSYFRGSEELPVERVSWDDCQEYIRRLNDLDIAFDGFRFSLPTEAQWEYACRAGTTTPYHFGKTLSGAQANYNAKYSYGSPETRQHLQKTTEVRSYPPNAWGLYDMHGNVSEWCLDWFGDYPRGRASDPIGPPPGKFRVVRGGHWNSREKNCRSASRGKAGNERLGNHPTSARNRYTGLRLVLINDK